MCTHPMDDATKAADINCTAKFLAFEQVVDPLSCPAIDCIVLCGSAILQCPETVFSALKAKPGLTQTLVLSGGIGHSTRHLYDATLQNPRYSSLATETRGLPEARVLCMILGRYYNLERIEKSGCRIVVEDMSTNCGANAVETRKALEALGIPTPRTFMIIPDPTMSLRTVAAFQKAYSDLPDPPKYIGCPTFVPRVAASAGVLRYDTAGGTVDAAGV